MAETRTIETGTDDLQARVEDGVAILTMNRPKRRNAMSGPMVSAMAAALQEAEASPEVRCVVLTGAGGELELAEDLVDPTRGVPRDLDGDGLIDNLDHSDDYQLLPVALILRWKGATGVRQLRVLTMLADR